MAEQLPRVTETQRGAQSWSRDWYSYDEYQNVHVSYLNALYAEGLILRHSLEFRETVDRDGNLIAVYIGGASSAAMA